MYIVTSDEMYELDRYTIQEIGLDENLLMENAGRAVAWKVREVVSSEDRIGVLAGAGNNGGDGFVIARTLQDLGYQVEVVQIAANEKITGAAAYHKKLFLRTGGCVSVVVDAPEIIACMQKWHVVIDAMIGIGVKNLLREPVAGVVSHINEKEYLVVSVDIPTGLPADEGIEDFTAIRADYTYVIEAVKMSLFIEQTAPFYGAWEVVSIGIPLNRPSLSSTRRTWDENEVQVTLPGRGAFSHKGTHGKGMLIGGQESMPGSVAMTARAALRSGSGLITIGTTEKAIRSIAGSCLEATYWIIPESGEDHFQQRSLPTDDIDAFAVGMGLGHSNKALEMVLETLRADRPIIIDADGLYHLKNNLGVLAERKQPTVITPHPGEMAMLMDITVPELLRSPFQYAKHLATKWQIYVVLKGAYTIITNPDGEQRVNHTGNQGLAKGGSGDVLSGILLAMIMQHENIFHAICNACFLQGTSADFQVENGHSYHDLLATDVIDGLPAVFRSLSARK